MYSQRALRAPLAANAAALALAAASPHIRPALAAAAAIACARMWGAPYARLPAVVGAIDASCAAFLAATIYVRSAADGARRDICSLEGARYKLAAA